MRGGRPREGLTFELHMEKVKAAETWLRTKRGDVRGALLLLWSESWQQTLCRSLPDDDELVALPTILRNKRWRGLAAVLRFPSPAPERAAHAVVAFALAALAIASPSMSVAVDFASASGTESLDAHTRIGFELAKFPQGEGVGIVGTSYLVDVGSSGLAIGPSIYAAATGRRGGFFTFGGEVAWRVRWLGPLDVEAGIYAGGGGGAGAPQGGGLMLRPHLDLLWDVRHYAFGLSVSKIKFPNGRIDSTQVGLSLEVASNFKFIPTEKLQSVGSAGGRTGIGFDRMQTVASIYRSRSAGGPSGGAQPKDIFLIGVRAERLLAGKTYWGLEASGAATPQVAGYAEYLTSLGFEREVIGGRFDVGARLAVGMGGGGGVSTGGGLLSKASVYGMLRLSNDFGLLVEGGAIAAPKGHLHAATASTSLIWSFDDSDAGGISTRPSRTDFGAGLERFSAGRNVGGARPLTADVLTVDRFVFFNLFLTGQVHSAVSGNAGGYSAALVGLGWAQPIASRLEMGGEILAGAAGGGGVDSRGIVVQPEVFAGFRITPVLTFRVGAGRVKSPRGTIASTVVNGGLVVKFGV